MFFKNERIWFFFLYFFLWILEKFFVEWNEWRIFEKDLEESFVVVEKIMKNYEQIELERKLNKVKKKITIEKNTWIKLKNNNTNHTIKSLKTIYKFKIENIKK